MFPYAHTRITLCHCYDQCFVTMNITKNARFTFISEPLLCNVEEEEERRKMFIRQLTLITYDHIYSQLILVLV